MRMGIRSLRSQACTWRARALRRGSDGYSAGPANASSTYSPMADDSDSAKSPCTSVGTRAVRDRPA